MLDSYQEIDQYLQENKASNIVGIDGMLTAILSGPKLISPSKWLELAGADQIQFNSVEQIKQILGALIKLSNDIIINLQNKAYAPLTLLDDNNSNWEQHLLEATIWSRGYLRGVKTWEIDLDLLDEDKENDINNIILPIVSLTIPDNEFKTNDSNQNLLEFRQEAVSSLPYIAMLAYDFWLPYREYGLPVSMDNKKYKTGRNDNCPCGSGKKYKKCCLN